MSTWGRSVSSDDGATATTAATAATAATATGRNGYQSTQGMIESSRKKMYVVFCTD